MIFLKESASKEAEMFGDLYDSADYNEYRSVFDSMDEIFSKYDENGSLLVTDIYDMASEKDKKQLMELVRIANEPSTSEGKLSKSYHFLLDLDKRRNDYENGYVDAIQDMMKVFNISL